MLGLLSGYWYSQVLYVLAELGLADCLASGPKTAETLAQDTHCHEATLYRFLRALASAGILHEMDPGRFALTPLSETLRSDRRDSLRAAARLGGHPLHWQAWGNLLHSVRSGEPAFDATHGKSFFEALATDSPSAAAFQGVLDQLDHVDHDVVEALDLSRCERIVDVGGGGGGLARRIAAAHPRAAVVLFDQAHVLAMAPADDRIDAVPGNFLESVPQEADAYVLKFVLHDWDDARAIRILQNCRAAMQPDGRVVVVEMIVPDDATPSIAKTHDLNMLVLTGGRERRLDEYRALFAASGLHVAVVRSTPQGVGVLQGQPASQISP
jgi:2-polyprenyl-3-methyl-5-hydroxy-6-metoxy-1,4-benzoquinol methylase